MQSPSLIGVIHLPPLPSSPRSSLSLDEIVSVAVAEATTMQCAAFHGVIIENYGDVPFYPREVPPVTVSTMTIIAHEVRRAINIAIGINVLRNDPQAALAIATASNADFVRINVHAGARVTDQGIVEGNAHITLRQRQMMRAERIALYCDVDVKHSSPLASSEIGNEAEDLVERALADAILVTGSATGRRVNLDHLSRVRRRVRVPVFAASGVTASTLSEVQSRCDGVIIGSALRRGGEAGAPLEKKRVTEIARRFRKAASP